MVHIMLGTYNGEKYIKEQIDSIIQQTYKEWKLYISDDSSNEITPKIIDEYVKRYENKIILLPRRIRENGAKGNYAYLFNKIDTANYYLFCDQDDIWKSDKLKYMVRIMDKKNNGIPRLLYHDIEVVDSNMNTLCSTFQEYSGLYLNNNNSFQQLLINNCIPGCCMIFNDSLKRLVNRISLESGMHDWWVVLVVKCFEGEVIHDNKVLGYYRQHGNNEIGALKETKLIDNLIKSFKIWNFKTYKKNNQILKNTCIIQANELLNYYGKMIKEENCDIIQDFIKIIESRNRLKSLWWAHKKGYIFKSFIYTIKYYLL